jgi:hypothetical protein
MGHVPFFVAQYINNCKKGILIVELTVVVSVCEERAVYLPFFLRTSISFMF